MRCRGELVNDVLDQTTPMRQRVEHLESLLQDYPTVDCPVEHRFSPGIYMREMLIPAGVCATGAVHKGEHITIVVGHCWLTTEQGMQEFKGYASFVTAPGMKRAVYAQENTMITTVHANPSDERDLDKLIPMLVEARADELLGGEHNRQRLANVAAQEKLS
jgi:hypothetical protein